MAADRALWFDKLCRIQEGSTLITLVSPSPFISAVRTSSGHISICKESLALWAVELLRLFFCYISMVVHFGEDVLDDLSLERSAGTSEVVEGDVEPLVDVTMDSVVMVTELSWGYSLLKGSCLTGCTIFICSADIECLISTGAAETCKNIGTENLCQVSKVRNVVYIWKC